MNLKLMVSEQLKRATLQFQIRCGAFFRVKRLQANKIEDEAADHLGVSRQVLLDYESGKEGIPLNHVHFLSIYLGIPPEEILELHLDFEGRAVLKPFREQELWRSCDIGAVIRHARETVSLTPNEVADLISTPSHSVSENDILLLESGKQEPPIEVWIKFCRTIHLPIEAIDGYSLWDHLKGVSLAFKAGKIRFPIRQEVLNVLDEYQAAHDENHYKSLYLMQIFK